MKKIISILFIMVLAISIVGCSKDNDKDKKEEMMSITDVRGRTVEIPKEIKSAYYPYYYENLLTICGEDIFTKISATSRYDTEFYSKTTYDIIKEKAKGFKDVKDVGTTIKDNFDIEKLISLKPDVVILGNYQYDSIGEEGIKNLKNAGIPTVFIDYTDVTPKAHIESTKILGKIFNKEKRAKELTDQYEQKVKKISDIVKKIPKENRKSVYLECRGSLKSYKDYGRVYGKKGMLTEMANYAGLKNIYDDAIENLGDPDPELLFKKDPDAMFIDGGNFNSNGLGLKTGYTVKENETRETLSAMIKNRKGWEHLKAVKNNQVYAIDNDIMRTLRDYVIIEYMGKALYPKEFSEFDPVKENREFIEKYVPILPSDSTFFMKAGK